MVQDESRGRGIGRIGKLVAVLCESLFRLYVNNDLLMKGKMGWEVDR